MTPDTPLQKARIIEFPKICDPRGETRGGHAHYVCQTVLIAVSGSLSVRLTDGVSEQVFHLDRSNKGLLIPAGVWDVMENFTTGTVVLALASHQYEEEDYIRDFDRYCEYAREKFQLK